MDFRSSLPRAQPVDPGGIETGIPSPPPRRRRRWVRVLVVALIAAGSVGLNLASLVAAGILLFQQPWFLMWFMSQVQTHQTAEGLQKDPAPPSGPAYAGPTLDATTVESAPDLFRPDRLWETHLKFSQAEFKALGPDRIPPVRDWIAPDGTPTLRNPLASRPGVAGTLGFDLPWSRGEVEFSGVRMTQVGIRYKGNGTLFEAMQGYKKSFKLDLNDGAPGRAFAGQKTLNLHNLIADRSCLADTLGYEFYREAGVPAPLTGFTRVHLTVRGRWEKRLLGLYLMVENPDKRWARRVFGTGDVVLFKPVGERLFEDAGGSWATYEQIYGPRTPVSPEQRAQLMGLCRLVSTAPDPEFSRRIGDFLDLAATARYLACEVLLSNYDGLLMNGQNFILWLDPRSGRFGFSPWDLDHSWGEFGQVGSLSDRERASIDHPWVGHPRLLERLFGDDAFRERYRGELRRLRETLFVPERLGPRIDELAAVVRPAVAEEPGDRLGAFEWAVASPETSVVTDNSRGERAAHHGAHQLKRFIRNRAASIDAQLAGQGTGVQLQRRTLWWSQPPQPDP